MENPTKMDDLGVPLFEEGLKKKTLTIPVDFHDIPMIFPLTINIPINYQYPVNITINIPINYQYPINITINIPINYQYPINITINIPSI